MGKESYYSLPEISGKLRLSVDLLALELSKIFASISLNLNPFLEEFAAKLLFQ
jgi:hypothetical protein